jgi:hypothetical protein
MNDGENENGIREDSEINKLPNGESGFLPPTPNTANHVASLSAKDAID